MIRQIHTQLYSRLAYEIVYDAIRQHLARKPWSRMRALEVARDVTGETIVLAEDGSDWLSEQPIFSEVQVKKSVGSYVRSLRCLYQAADIKTADRLELVAAVLQGDRNYDVKFRKDLQAEVIGTPRDPVAAEVLRMCRDRLKEFDAETSCLMHAMDAEFSSKGMSMHEPECLKRAVALQTSRRIKRKALLDELRAAVKSID